MALLTSSRTLYRRKILDLRQLSKHPTMCNGQKGVAEISKNEQQFNKHLEKDELVIFILLPPCCLLGTNGAVGRRGIVKKVIFVY